MKLLAIDTSTKFLCLGLADKTLLYEYRIESSRRHLSILVPTIKRTLEALGWSAGDLDYFAVGLGPGSFTGLRVGVAAIKGLAFAYKKPIVGLSTLDIIAHNCADREQPLAVALDAKRGLIYCGIYKKTKGILRKVSRDSLMTKEEFITKIRNNTIIAGDCLDLHKDFFQQHLNGIEFTDRDYWYPQAHNLLLLALDKIREKRFYSAYDVKPVYLYPKECQIKA